MEPHILLLFYLCNHFLLRFYASLVAEVSFQIQWNDYLLCTVFFRKFAYGEDRFCKRMIDGTCIQGFKSCGIGLPRFFHGTGCSIVPPRLDIWEGMSQDIPIGMIRQCMTVLSQHMGSIPSHSVLQDISSGPESLLVCIINSHVWQLCIVAHSYIVMHHASPTCECFSACACPHWSKKKKEAQNYA